MTEILKLLLPVIIQLLPTLINKPKPAMVGWCADGAKAALAEKKPFVAFVLGSLECAFNTMDDAQYGDIQRAVIVCGTLAKGVTEKQAAEGGVQ